MATLATFRSFFALLAAIATPGRLVEQDKRNPTLQHNRVSQGETILLNLKGADLKACIGQLSAITGLRFLAEPEEHVRKRDVALSGNLDVVLTGVSSQFGYRWERCRTGTIFFRRVFDDPDRVPQVVPDELSADARDIVRAIDLLSFPKDLGAAKYISAVPQALSTDQIRTLESGEPLPLTSLTSRQLSLVTAALLNHRLADTYQVWKSTAAILNRQSAAWLQFAEGNAAFAPSGARWADVQLLLPMPDNTYVGLSLTPTRKQ